jgi:eukaryotic-like serine/threonine-protein kinase
MKFLRFVMRSLVLLLIALFSALAAMRLAIHGREVRVPDLVGMSTAQAQETANTSGLIVSIEDKFYSASVPTGKVISQAPSADTRVRRGWRVRVAESLGPQRVPIPDVVGESERAATINLQRRGLEIAAVAGIALSSASPDQVVAQVPPANATGVASPKIRLLVAQKPDDREYVLPNFVGRSVAEAQSRILQAGLPAAAIMGQSLQPTSTQPSPLAGAPPPHPTGSGTVVSQSPPAGSRVNAATVIHLETRP